jgi:DNA-binding CsgD family transcriptional regulator
LDCAVDARLLVAATIVAALGMSTRSRLGSRRPDLQGTLGGLSAREVDVAGLLESDLTLREIALVLGVSLHTVRAQTASVYRKLGVHSRAGLRGRLRTESTAASDPSAVRVSTAGDF